MLPDSCFITSIKNSIESTHFLGLSDFSPKNTYSSKHLTIDALFQMSQRFEQVINYLDGKIRFANVQLKELFVNEKPDQKKLSKDKEQTQRFFLWSWSCLLSL